MRAILMAAGRGSRISRHIGDQPKCTLNVGGTTLIAHTVDMLLKHDIDVTVIVGFKGEAVRETLKNYSVTFYENPFYDVTNSIASLWFARHELGDAPLILANGDVYWEDDVLDILLQDERSTVMLGDSSRKEEGDYRFGWSEDMILTKHGKELQLPDITGEYVGIAKLDVERQVAFASHLNLMIHQQRHQVWWENVLYDMMDTEPIYINDISPHFWGEVDYIEDYTRILVHRKDNGCSNIDLTHLWR